jgi:predicted amidophosphoribosyltransferase
MSKGACDVCEQPLKEIAAYEICRTCGWQDDHVQAKDPNFENGPNQMSLTQARAYWKSTGKRVNWANRSAEMNDIQRLAISLIEKQQ